MWLPAWLPSVGHHHALVLVTTIGPLPGAVTAPCPSQAPPPNPIAAEPDGRRVLSRGGAADHEVTPQAPLTGSGWREHSYGGFGGGHPHFHPHAAPPGNPRIERQTEGLSSWARGIRRRAGPPSRRAAPPWLRARHLRATWRSQLGHRDSPSTPTRSPGPRAGARA